VRPVVRIAAAGGAAVVGAGALGGDGAALLAVQVLSGAALLGLLVDVPLPVRRRRPPAPDSDGRERFPSYDRVVAAVVGSRQSARVVDLQLRPVLARLVSAKVEQLGAERVRAVVGEQVWWLADETRPARSDSREGGLDPAQLTHVVERLEAL
jgi:hypothetical protein